METIVIVTREPVAVLVLRGFEIHRGGD
jgi:hypothetical protein